MIKPWERLSLFMVTRDNYPGTRGRSERGDQLRLASHSSEKTSQVNPPRTFLHAWFIHTRSVVQCIHTGIIVLVLPVNINACCLFSWRWCSQLIFHENLGSGNKTNPRGERVIHWNQKHPPGRSSTFSYFCLIVYVSYLISELFRFLLYSFINSIFS